MQNLIKIQKNLFHKSKKHTHKAGVNLWISQQASVTTFLVGVAYIVVTLRILGVNWF